jgi:hypothetical protein
MTLELLHSEFPYTHVYEENLIFFSISVYCITERKVYIERHNKINERRNPIGLKKSVCIHITYINSYILVYANLQILLIFAFF